MKIGYQQLINSPVYTLTGTLLGRVVSFQIDSESQSILEYFIKPTNLVKEIIKGDLVISRGQVIEIKKDRLIVDDSYSEHPLFRKLNILKKGEKKPVTSQELN